MSAAKDRATNNNLYRRGQVVEVSSDDEGFTGAWYVATILRSPTFLRTTSAKRTPKALIKYHSLLSDIDENEQLTEYVDVSFIRPLPPRPDIDQCYEPHDVVDAFHRDGWWKGVVLKVEDDKRYTVIFENPPEKLEFFSAHLRFHCDWIDGKWVKSPQQKRMQGLKFSKGMAVEVNLEKEDLLDAWFPAIIIDEVGFNSFLVKFSSSMNADENGSTEETIDCFHIRVPPPNLEVKKFEILETVDVFHNSCWRDGLITKVLTEGRYNVYLKSVNKEKQFTQSEIRPCLYLVNGTWISYCRDMPFSVQREEESTFADSKTKNPAAAIPIESSSAGKDCHEEKSSPKNSKNNPSEQSTPHNAKSTSKNAKKRTAKGEETLLCPSKKLKKEKSANSLSLQACDSTFDTPKQEVKVTGSALTKCSTQHMVEISSVREDRSKAKSLHKNLKKNSSEQSTPCNAKSMRKKEKNRTTKSEETLSCLSKKFKEENSANSLSLPACDPDNQPSAGSESPFRGKNMEPNKKEAGLNDQMTGSMEKRKRRLNSQGTSHSVPAAGREDKIKGDSAEVIVEVEHIEKYADSSVTLAEWRRDLRAEHSYQDLDEEIRMQKESDLIGQQKEGEQHNEAGGGASEMDFEDYATKEAEVSAQNGMEPGGGLVKASALVSSADHMGKEVDDTIGGAFCDTNNDSQPLSTCFEDGNIMISLGMPFMKSSSIWQNIESLEVFQLLPQKPHFGPLIDCKEASREGFAIGHMVNFATVVEKTSKLQIDSPQNLFDNYLETLADLEILGFDVKAVVDRLNRLLSIKVRREQLQHKSKNVISQIEECSRETTKLREDIDAIDKLMSELEEKRAMDVSMKVMKESEIITLQADATLISEDILNAKHDFESLAAARW